MSTRDMGRGGLGIAWAIMRCTGTAKPCIGHLHPERREDQLGGIKWSVFRHWTEIGVFLVADRDNGWRRIFYRARILGVATVEQECCYCEYDETCDKATNDRTYGDRFGGRGGRGGSTSIGGDGSTRVYGCARADGSGEDKCIRYGTAGETESKLRRNDISAQKNVVRLDTIYRIRANDTA